jgi:hypothetical protein
MEAVAMHLDFGRSLEIIDRTLWDFPYWRLPRRPTVKILVVVDGSVGVAASYFFGVGKIIEILRKSAPHNDPDFGYVNFDVEIATRDAAPVAGTANYTNFRFDQVVDGQPLINRFQQIWCFGFHPGNTGNPADTPIEAHATHLETAELRELTRWMNERRGGVLAMGDHHFLGATLAWKIPRIRSMRRWTNQDGVPPIDTPITSGGGPTRYRHDTNQPQNAAQANPVSPAVIPNGAEQDGIPQKIKVRYFGGIIKKRPHPILCARTYGVINVLPDHPHEGWVYEDAEVPAANAYDFGGGIAGPDFPDAVDGGSKPLPQAIAWARPWPEPPYDHQKSPTSVEQFAVIGVYDGHRANIGRAVVDSTWHHWFNMNIDGIQAAAGPGATTEQVASWAKVKAYFRNVAVWLSPPAKQHAMLTYAAFWSLGSSLAVEGYDGGMPSWELGETARDILGQQASACQIFDWIFPHIPFAVLERFRLPLPEPCLSCPPWELIENAALGGIIKTMLPERDRLVAERLRGKVASVDVKLLADAVEKGTAAGLAELRQRWEKDLEQSKKALTHFDAPTGAARRKLKNELKEVLEDLEVIAPEERKT